MKKEYIVTHDSIVKEYMLELGLSRRFCRNVKLYGNIFINGIKAKNFFPLKKDDILTLEYNETINPLICVTNKEIDIVYENDYLLIVNKPESLATQPSRKHFEDNLVSMVKNYFEQKEIDSNVHIVTRLDYQTSGLVLIAKNGYYHHLLTNCEILKKYYAIVKGKLQCKKGIIDYPILRESPDSIKRKVDDNGKNAITEYEVIKENKDNSLLDIRLLTGRTHQIRVHFSYIGHPVVGDKLYGEEADRLYLHCYYLKIIIPKNQVCDEETIIECKLNPTFYKCFSEIMN